MPEDPGIMADIDRDEQWLRAYAPLTPAPRSVEHLKLQVQIALEESRLEASPTLSVGPACVARVRQAVRDELAVRAGRGRRSRLRRLLPLAIGVWVARRAGKSAGEFFLSGRSMPWWLLGISMSRAR